jgi:hypothetical protein
LQLDLEKLTCGVEEFRNALIAEGLPDCGGRWPESYEEPVFAGRAQARCAGAEALRETTVVLGLPPSWERMHVELCVAAVKKVLRAYRR